MKLTWELVCAQSLSLGKFENDGGFGLCSLDEGTCPQTFLDIDLHVNSNHNAGGIFKRDVVPSPLLAPFSAGQSQ